MSKKIKTVAATIKLVIKAGQAKPGPPVGPALGQAGLNLMSFCKDFNAKTADIKDDVPIPVQLTAYSDKTFEYVMRTPPATYLIKKAAGLESASQRPGHQTAATISSKHIYEIAKVKQKDLQKNIPLESICRTLVGTCKSMGIKVIPKPEQTL